MTFTPINNQVILTREEEIKQTTGGIIIPDNAGDLCNTAIVVAVGPGSLLQDGSRAKPQVKVGDRVLLDKYKGNPFEYEKVKYITLTENEIISILGQ